VGTLPRSIQREQHRCTQGHQHGEKRRWHVRTLRCSFTSRNRGRNRRITGPIVSTAAIISYRRRGRGWGRRGRGSDRGDRHPTITRSNTSGQRDIRGIRCGVAGTAATAIATAQAAAATATAKPAATATTGAISKEQGASVTTITGHARLPREARAVKFAVSASTASGLGAARATGPRSVAEVVAWATGEAPTGTTVARCEATPVTATAASHDDPIGQRGAVQASVGGATTATTTPGSDSGVTAAVGATSAP